MTRFERSEAIVNWLVVGTALAAVIFCAYRYLYVKEYYFIVEADCDSSKELCYMRSCDQGECPPNGLSEYKRYSINAADFAKCTDNSCQRECQSGSISCLEIACDANVDACSTSQQ